MTLMNKKIWKAFVNERKLVDPKRYMPKSALYTGIWDEEALKEAIRSKLLQIAEEFWNSLEVEADIKDITITGSIANYNWTDFSDIDLHIIVDFTQIPFEKDLVGDFFKAKASLWNRKHDIFMSGHQVEIYIQDFNEPHHSTGVFSLQDNSWVVKPERKNIAFDDNLVAKKANMLADQIERAQDFLEEKNYTLAYDFSDKLKEKIRNFRKSGLEDGGEYSPENLAFKILRNSEYLGLLDDVYVQSYDKMMSLGNEFGKKLDIFVKNDLKSNEMKLNEIEKYQKKIRSRHKRMKKRLIGHGKQKNSPPYAQKPSYKRSKSAPAGAGGA
jgi:predicted nucleotidyltransferase